MIFFNLPDQKNREEIVAQYAKQLKKHELVQLAAAMEECVFLSYKKNINKYVYGELGMN